MSYYTRYDVSGTPSDAVGAEYMAWFRAEVEPGLELPTGRERKSAIALAMVRRMRAPQAGDPSCGPYFSKLLGIGQTERDHAPHTHARPGA